MMFHVKLKFMICIVSSPGTGRKAAEEDCLSFLTILLLTIKPTVNFNILNHKYFLFSYTVTLPTVHTLLQYQGSTIWGVYFASV